MLALALAAGLWAVVGSHEVFPYLSDDHDEALYLLQADALANGHLFPPAPDHPDAFVPWLSVLRDGKFVLKYSPVHASILALGVGTLGSARVALGLIAAGVVVLTYALAKEVLGDRRLALLASAFLALSPLFLIQSATFLPYCSSLLLLEAFAFTLLRGLRTGRGAVLALSGFLFGLALFARPFDALLFGTPLVLYSLIRGIGQRAQRGRNAGWLALGLVLPAAGMLLYYHAATGSLFRPPFNLLEPNDTIGFGPRRLTPGQPALPFTPTLGWYGVGRHVLLTSFWGFGGLLLSGLFVFGVFRRQRGGPEAAVALVAVTFACGYAFFWGTYGTSLRGSLTGFLGPFYFLPVLACVALLAARGFGELWRRDWVMAAVAVAAMVLVSGYLLAEAFRINLRLSEEDRRLYTPVAAASLDRAIVLVPPMWGPHLLHPFAWLENDANYDGRTVYALDRGEPANLALLDSHPQRTPYRLRLHGVYRADPPDPSLTSSLERLTVLEQRALQAKLTLQNETGDPYVSVTVTVNGRKATFLLDSSSHAGKRYDASIHIRTDGVEWDGPFEAHGTESVASEDFISVAILTGPTEDASPRTVHQQQFGYAIDGPMLRVLLPGELSVNELGHNPLAVAAGS
ncbi:MAG: glycosyltransferase family 39 protein [Acidimicrobiales bacterium]